MALLSEGPKEGGAVNLGAADPAEGCRAVAAPAVLGSWAAVALAIPVAQP